MTGILWDHNAVVDSNSDSNIMLLLEWRSYSEGC